MWLFVATHVGRFVVVARVAFVAMLVLTGCDAWLLLRRAMTSCMPCIHVEIRVEISRVAFRHGAVGAGSLAPKINEIKSKLQSCEHEGMI